MTMENTKANEQCVPLIPEWRVVVETEFWVIKIIFGEEIAAVCHWTVSAAFQSLELGNIVLDWAWERSVISYIGCGPHGQGTKVHSSLILHFISDCFNHCFTALFQISHWYQVHGTASRKQLKKHILTDRVCTVVYSGVQWCTVRWWWWPVNRFPTLGYHDQRRAWWGARVEGWAQHETLHLPMPCHARRYISDILPGDFPSQIQPIFSLFPG